MNDLTVLCVFVNGPYPYTPEYVIRLERMVRKHLDRPFRFVCLTDQPKAFNKPIETIEIPPTVAPGVGGYWSKIRLFDTALGLAGRLAFFDLDVLIVSDLAPIVDYAAPFAICECELRHERPAREVDKWGHTIIRAFNASVMVWDAGQCRDFYEGWAPSVAARLSGDQDWYAERHPGAAVMPYEWFPRISRLTGEPPASAKVVLVKTPKNHLAGKKYPWFDALWGGLN